jgi:hypothetical protein
MKKTLLFWVFETGRATSCSLSRRLRHELYALATVWFRVLELDYSHQGEQLWHMATVTNSNAKLRELFASHGVTADKEAITHCVIGGRGNQTWFVLKYLLGHSNVRHYDGAWLEWGGLIGAPIET